MSDPSATVARAFAASLSPRIRVQTVLLLTGFSGLPIIAAFTVLGFPAPGYDSLHQTFSSIEFTSFGTAQRVNFFVFGVLLCLFGSALHRALSPGRGAVLVHCFR